MVSTVDSNVQGCLNAIKELANLYELSGQYSLTEKEQDRIFELRKTVKEKQKELRDLELLFHYAKKLLDANSEITFLVGEEFSSAHTAQTIHAANSHIEKKITEVKLAELDLLQAQKLHIEKNKMDTET